MQPVIHYDPDSLRLREDVIEALRETAARGGNIRELVDLICARHRWDKTATVPIIAYFAQAFHVSLAKVLPLREWLGTNGDAEIDALILPEIEQAKSKWGKQEPKVATAKR